MSLLEAENLHVALFSAVFRALWPVLFNDEILSPALVSCARREDLSENPFNFVKETENFNLVFFLLISKKMF